MLEPTSEAERQTPGKSGYISPIFFPPNSIVELGVCLAHVGELHKYIAQLLLTGYSDEQLATAEWLKPARQF